jgi:glycosyltransferase involved in cell wall biosynthesis
MLKVLHIIVGLDLGGAETMLKRLIVSNSATRVETAVISLTSIGVIGESLRGHGVAVHALGMLTPWSFPVTLWRLIFMIRQYRPAIVQTWMYHADLIGGLAARLAGSYPIIWGVRSTSIPQGGWSITYWLVRLCGFFSHLIPDRIICCANSAKSFHLNLNYAENRMIVIPNGYIFSDFDFDLKLRIKGRLDLGLTDSDIVIGVVGRFDPLKDFRNFVVAASLVASKFGNVKFLMVGRDNEWSNSTLRGWIENVGLVDRFHLVGQQSDVAYFLSVMDIFCLSSVSEAFPNVVVEAMAIGLPCVVTRAGDAATILGDEDFVVPVNNTDALANALLKMCRLDPVDRKMLGDKNARKVRDTYAIEAISQRYEDVYEQVIKE